jgi:hypothetical protein
VDQEAPSLHDNTEIQGQDVLNRGGSISRKDWLCRWSDSLVLSTHDQINN